MPHEPGNHPEILAKLRKSKCFLVDMDGTFFRGNRLLPGAGHFLKVLESQGKQYIFITNNSSRDRQQYADKISRLGVEIPASRVFTSGEATALFLQSEMPDAKLFVVGTDSLESEFIRCGFTLDSHQPDATVLGFDTNLTYSKLTHLCDLVRTGIPYIATHPDINCPVDDGFIPDIGCTIAYVQASTGRKPDKIIGKPHRGMVMAAAKRVNLDLSSLAMIGDRLYTDIALGKNAGIPAFLVLSGETHLEDIESSPYQPDGVFINIGELADLLESLTAIED